MINNKTIVDEIIERYPPELIIFIGAGASVGFGKPLMQDFFRRYFNEFTKDALKKRIEGKKNIQGDDLLSLCILNFIEEKGLDKTQELRVDLEDLLSYLVDVRDEIKHFVNTKEGLSNALNLALSARFGLENLKSIIEDNTSLINIWKDFTSNINDAIDYLIIRLYEVYDINIEEHSLINEISNRYRIFFNYIIDNFMQENGNIVVFTTNYDPCLDIFFEKEGSNYYRVCLLGLDKRVRIETWSLNNYVIPTNTPVFALFNLHGSVLWTEIDHARATRRNLDEPLDVSKIKIEKIGLAPPVLYKEELEIFRDLYNVYEKMCRNSTTRYFISIGYSFRDKRIVNMTVDGLGYNESKIINISPNANESFLRGKFQTRYIPINCGFEDNSTIIKSFKDILKNK